MSESPGQSERPAVLPSRRGRLLGALALGITVVVAGVLVRFGSADPDGLERVAQDQGLAGSAVERTGLLSYDSGALVGVVIVMLVSLVLVRLVRRGR